MTHLVEQFLNDALAFNISDRKTLAMAVLPKVVAYNLAIPSSPVDNPELHYISSHLTFVNNVVSTINESVVIDVDLFVSAVKAIWLTRYRLVYLPSTPEADAVVNSALVATVLSNDVASFIVANKDVVNTLTYQYVESVNARSLEY